MWRTTAETSLSGEYAAARNANGNYSGANRIFDASRDWSALEPHGVPIISSSVLSASLPFLLDPFFFHGTSSSFPFTYSAVLSFRVPSESLPSPRSNFERLHIAELYAKPRRLCAFSAVWEERA